MSGSGETNQLAILGVLHELHKPQFLCVSVRWRAMIRQNTGNMLGQTGAAFVAVNVTLY